MIIVWSSIALAVVALVYLGISGLRTVQATRPALRSLSDTVADLQSKMEGITKETNQLKKHADHLKQEIQTKKRTVQDVIGEAKQSAEPVKTLRKYAGMAPNPKQLQNVEVDPRIQNIEDRVFTLWELWRRWRGRG